MRKIGIGLSAATMIAIAEATGTKGHNDGVRVDRVKGVRKKISKAGNKLNVFYGYASERVGKGQKKRNKAERRAKGWG